MVRSPWMNCKTAEPVDILGRILTLPEVSRMRGA